MSVITGSSGSSYFGGRRISMSLEQAPSIEAVASIAGIIVIRFIVLYGFEMMVNPDI
jgi:hypothetical protein